MGEAMHGLFVTATDTGAGKTYVTAAVARSLRRRGVAFRVCKPVATGTDRVADDTRLLAEAAGDPALDAITPWTFAAPAAPPVAARLAGAALALGDLVAAVRRRAAAGVLVLAEGVGGLLCPLTERETVADLAAVLGLPLVVVARRSLGTLNHTLLTLEAAERRRLAVAGVVVTETAPVDGPADETNVEELRRRIAVPLLAVFPHRPGAGVVAEADAVDWPALAADRGRRLTEPSAARPVST
jgi:dethiobiotin synthetase